MRSTQGWWAGEERRRAPKQSVVRRAFDEGWPAVCESVPRRVKREAEAYQRCGEVRYGFVEVACEDCETSRLVAFSCGNDRQGLERLARYGARGPVAESRLRRLEDSRYEYTPKHKAARAFIVTAEQLVRRLVSLVPPAKTHLTSFHGVYAPHAALRPLVTAPPPKPAPAAPASSSKKRRRPSRRLDWASLHQHTFGVDVLRCPCGGRRRIIAIHSTRKAAEERLTQLRHHLTPRRLLPPATAQPALPLAG